MTSPFREGGPSPIPTAAYERWLEEDLDSTARLLAGVWFALPLGLALWAMLALGIAYVLTRVH